MAPPKYFHGRSEVTTWFAGLFWRSRVSSADGVEGRVTFRRGDSTKSAPHVASLSHSCWGCGWGQRSLSLVPSKMSFLSLIKLSLTPSSFSVPCTEAGRKKHFTNSEGRSVQHFHVDTHAYMQSHMDVFRQRTSVVPQGPGYAQKPLRL